MTDAELKAIRERCENSIDDCPTVAITTLVEKDIPALLAYVERLQRKVDLLEAMCVEYQKIKDRFAFVVFSPVLANLRAELAALDNA